MNTPQHRVINLSRKAKPQTKETKTPKKKPVFIRIFNDPLAVYRVRSTVLDKPNPPERPDRVSYPELPAQRPPLAPPPIKTGGGK